MKNESICVEKSDIAQRIRKYRKLKHWSQEHLAMESGVSKESIGRIERGRCRPRMETVEKIERALGLNANVLLMDYQKQVQKDFLDSAASITKEDFLRWLEYELSDQKVQKCDMRIMMNLVNALINALQIK